MLSKDEDARLIAHVALRHDQELDSFLDDHRPFDLLPIMRRRTSWSCEWLLPWCIHSIQALRFEIKSEWFRHTRELPRSCEVGVRWCKVRQHLYWTDDIWCFLEAMDTQEFGHWDLLNVDYTGLDLISSVKRLFPLTFVSSSFSEAANHLRRKRE